MLGSLLNNADAPSKKVISSYNFNASYKANLDKIKAHNATVLEACASYLGFKVREGDKKLYKNQEILCDRLILKIESLFDMDCSECKETYRNELTDKPLFRCQLCLQGSHNCTEMIKKAEALKELQDKGQIPPGTTWLCHECLKKNNLALVPSPKTAKTSQPDSNSTLKPIDEEEEEEDAGVEEEEEEGERDSPRRNREDNAVKNREGTKICKLYRQRKCPHGLTGKRLVGNKPCPNQHPRRCRFYEKFGNDKVKGCKKGKDCKFFHPKLCNDSVNSRCCLNKDCTFHHLKGTARKLVDSNKTEADIPPAIGSQLRDRRGEAPDFMDNRGWPPLRKVVSSQELQKMGSAQSLYTPYPPTIDNSRAFRPRRESTSEKDKAFLEKLMESMKDGIIAKMDAKMAELQNQIPAMVQEAQWNQAQRIRQDSHQSMGPQLIPRPQSSQGIPLNAPSQQQLQMQMPMNYMPTFLGSCY